MGGGRKIWVHRCTFHTVQDEVSTCGLTLGCSHRDSNTSDNVFIDVFKKHEFVDILYYTSVLCYLVKFLIG